MLPLEIYKKILAHFSLREKLDLEKVCKGWKQAMPYRNEKRISLESFQVHGRHFSNLAEFYPQCPEDFEFLGNFVTLILSSSVLQSILVAIALRCGDSIEDIDFSVHKVKPLHFSAQVGAFIDGSVAGVLLDLFPNLKSIRFYHSILTSESLQYLQNIDNLSSVEFSGSRIILPSQDEDSFESKASEIFQNFIEYPPNLTSLSLEAPEFLPEFSNHRLRRVSIANVGGSLASLFESWLWKLTKNCSNITDLRLKSVPVLEGFSVIIRQIPNLRSLSLHHTSFPFGGLSVLCRTCSYLKVLRLAYVSFPGFEPSDLRTLRGLEEVSFNHWSEFSSLHLGHIAYSSGSTLHRILIKGCDLKNKDLRLLRHCKVLKDISVHGSQATPLGVLELRKLCPSLKLIDFGTTTIVSNDLLQSIGETPSNLRELIGCPTPGCLLSKSGLYSLIESRCSKTVNNLRLTLTGISLEDKTRMATRQTLRKLAAARVELKFRIIP